MMVVAGGNVSNDFKDGSTNKVQNLKVNLSPTSSGHQRNAAAATAGASTASIAQGGALPAEFKTHGTFESTAQKRGSASI